MSENVLVYCEQRGGALQKVSLELIGKGRALAETLGQKVAAVLLGKNIAGLAQELIDYGADEVIYTDDDFLSDYMTEPYAKAFAAIIKSRDPEIVLVGATSIGRDLAPRVSARIKTGLTADCTGLDIDEETKGLLMTRPAFGGNIMATIISPKHRPQMATVRPGVMAAKVKEPRKGAITEFKADFVPADKNVKIIKTVKQEKKSKDITEAKILVSGGRGIGADFSVLQPLANALGAEISSSRAQVDLGRAEKDRQVGQTGKTVRPNVYFALGISGAIQHVAGMEGSDLIIAVNKDPGAQIFQYADLGVVGDVHKILPKLVDLLQKEKQNV